MIDITKDAVTYEFSQTLDGVPEAAQESRRPGVLTVKGKAAAVVQDAEAYQHLLDIAAQGDAGEGIRQGLQDAKAGKLRPAREFFAECEAGRVCFTRDADSAP